MASTARRNAQEDTFPSARARQIPPVLLAAFASGIQRRGGKLDPTLNGVRRPAGAAMQSDVHH